MKTLIMLLIFIISFAGFFFIISLFGMLWNSYYEVITSINWFICYSSVLGWWLSLFLTVEYYNRNKDDITIF